MSDSPSNSLLLLWSRQIAPRLSEYLGLSAKLRPVTAFFAPLVFITVFILLFMGFLPYSVEIILDWRMVFFLRFSCWFAAFLHIISVKRFSLYLVKRDVPLLLSCFLVFIEIISEFSKPFSLGIRLYANLVFGHYLLLGVWIALDYLGLWAYGFSVVFVLFELAVFVVQSYIFTVLIILYFHE